MTRWRVGRALSTCQAAPRGMATVRAGGGRRGRRGTQRRARVAATAAATMAARPEAAPAWRAKNRMKAGSMKPKLPHTRICS